MEKWDRQKNETHKAYHWFCQYRDHGLDRSLAKIVAEHKLNPFNVRQMELWSAQYSWVERSHAYDGYLELKLRKEQEAHLVEMRRRHVRQSMALQSKAFERLQGLDTVSLSAMELLRFLESGMKLEREAVGLSNKTEISGTVDIKETTTTRLSDKVIALSRELVKEFQPRD